MYAALRRPEELWRSLLELDTHRDTAKKYMEAASPPMNREKIA